MTRAGDQERLGWFTRPSAQAAPAANAPGHPLHQFELSSRGDRVSGLLLEPSTGPGPFPLVLLAQTTPGLPPAEPLPLGVHLAGHGMAVAQTDLPLHGARAEHKLAACVDAGWKGEGRMASLAREFAIQAQSDLRRSLDALCQEERIDAARVAFLGIGLGADVGALFCATDPRPRAAVLVQAGERPAAPELDPATAISRFTPRPMLLLETAKGHARRLHDAAQPSQMHHPLPDPEDLDRDGTRTLIQRFLCEALGL
jgi:dienelactone hydrolase